MLERLYLAIGIFTGTQLSQAFLKRGCFPSIFGSCSFKCSYTVRKVSFGSDKLIHLPESEQPLPLEAHLTGVIALGPREVRMSSSLVQLKLQDC